MVGCLAFNSALASPRDIAKDVSCPRAIDQRLNRIHYQPHTPLRLESNSPAKVHVMGEGYRPVASAWAALVEEITVTSAPRSGAWSMEVVCVDELSDLVTAAQRGDIDAFTELVRR